MLSTHELENNCNHTGNCSDDISDSSWIEQCDSSYQIEHPLGNFCVAYKIPLKTCCKHHYTENSRDSAFNNLHRCADQ